jgi:outer membrane lipoprotein-sorting protein
MAGAAQATGLDEVLASFDEAQDEVRTLSANFVQTTTNPMLKHPIRAEGKFFMTKPDAIRWEYSTPEQMSFVIANDRYTGYYPARKRAEKKNIQSYSKKVFRDLLKAYRVTLASGEVTTEQTHLLVLTPKKKRARKRVDEVRFWLDAASFLPTKVEYRGHDGSLRVVEFTQVSVNPDLAASLYTVEIPSDVKVTSGFSGIPNLNPGSSN